MKSFENRQFNNNCLALTIRNDYKLTIASNIVKKSRDLSFKVAFSFALLNFFSIILWCLHILRKHDIIYTK